jgi:hypothetical protein
MQNPELAAREKGKGKEDEVRKGVGFSFKPDDVRHVI